MIVRPKHSLKKSSSTDCALVLVEKNNTGWNNPQSVNCGGMVLRTGDLGIANNGTLYFAHSAGGISCIYHSKYNDGLYSTPEFVCSKNDSIACEGDTFVSPEYPSNIHS